MEELKEKILYKIEMLKRQGGPMAQARIKILLQQLAELEKE